jgi:hypothetical protein
VIVKWTREWFSKQRGNQCSPALAISVTALLSHWVPRVPEQRAVTLYQRIVYCLEMAKKEKAINMEDSSVISHG